jgi:hypothetical protein
VAIVRNNETIEKLSTIVCQQREKPERGNERGSNMSGEMVKWGIRIKSGSRTTEYVCISDCHK